MPSAAEFVLVALICAIVAAILYPVFMKSGDHRRRGVVLDGSGKPIVGANLRFVDSHGKLLATFKSDENGDFRGNVLDEVRNGAHLEGYGLFRSMGNTGGAGFIYWFSPPGTQTAFVHDEHGRPMPSTSLWMECIRNRRSFRNTVTDSRGNASWPTPLAARFDIHCEAPGWEVAKTAITARPRFVHYDVTIGASAYLLGKVMSSKGAPEAKAQVSMSRQENGSTVGNYLSTDSNEYGVFEFADLKPGDYELQITPAIPRETANEDFDHRPHVVLHPGERLSAKFVVP